ncbi:mRNA splicing protein [Kappamyces sp. JEL0680]|nr:mRNA splicing protein [Kappamyces sp. JEL0680]
MSFAASLPAPKHTLSTSKWAANLSSDEDEEKSKPKLAKKSLLIPPYGKRKGWVPMKGQVRISYALLDRCIWREGTEPARAVPWHPGRQTLILGNQSEKPLALQTDENGRIKYDVVLHQGSSMGGKKVGALSLTTYVKYVPSESQATSAGAASSRIIRLSEAPIDPFEPSRFKHRKEQKNWVIPPCISNWKNAKGYTIPLDKRLANDGRGLQDVTINDNFSKFSEALFIADRNAREEVKLRAEMASKVGEKVKMEKEAKLRELAQKAREERGALAALDNDKEPDSESESEDSDDEADMTAEEKRQLRERQQLRKEKARERAKELRRHGDKPTGERDISEKIALGLAQPTVSKESMYDQRLFNQTSGISQGFGAADAYDIYDKPLFQSAVSSIYKPTRGNGEEGVDTKQFESLLANKGPSRGFSGTDATQGASSGGPVVFEKEGDVFKIDAFMNAAKRGRDGPADSQTKDKKPKH